jgi:hypothetical protein
MGNGFWPSWVGVTIVGYAGGMALDAALYRATGTALSGAATGVASTALYGAVTGGLSGGLQALLLHRRLERSYEWALAGAAGGAYGFALGAAVAEIASNVIALRLDVYLAGAIIQLLFGALTGLGIGFAQWLLVRRRVANAGGWVPASVLGLTLGFSIPIGIMQLVDLPLLPVIFGVTGGLLLGLMQWLWGRRIVWTTID